MGLREFLDKRETVDAGKMIIGGALAAVFFEGYRQLFAPLEGGIENMIGLLIAVVAFLIVVYFAAFSFTILEKDIPQQEVNLTDKALDEIAERLNETEQIGGEETAAGDLDASELEVEDG